MSQLQQEQNKSIRLAAKILVLIFILFWMLVAGVPYFYMMITAMKTQGEFLSGNSFRMPATINVRNFVTVLQGAFMSYFKNSLMIVTLSLVILIAISGFAAYPLSRMKFKLNKPIYSLIVAAMSVPIHITLIPMFTMAIRSGLYDTPWVLIGPYVAFNLPVSVFIFTAFMQSIPADLEEAAEMDGCGKYATFFRIIVPLSKPSIATLAIYNGVTMWNEFSFAMTLTQSPEARTLPLAVWEYQGQYSMNIPMVMAVLGLSSLPIILLYVVGQDKLVKGMMAGAVKG